MISYQDSIPRKTKAFLKGIDVFYTQFNKVNFYVEDENDENLYFEILRKLFPKIKLNKIFPLGGKLPILEESKKFIGNKNKIYILDKDFDDILKKKITQANLFYLKEYSIENYLIDSKSFKLYVVEEKPKLEMKEINKLFNLSRLVKYSDNLFYRIVILFIFVQYKELGLKNTKYAPNHFFDFKEVSPLNNFTFTRYINEIALKLKEKDKRLSFEIQLKKMKQELELEDITSIHTHIPGIYILKFLKDKLESNFSLRNNNMDSFIFRLAKNNDFGNLKFLKDTIKKYINE